MNVVYLTQVTFQENVTSPSDPSLKSVVSDPLDEYLGVEPMMGTNSQPSLVGGGGESSGDWGYLKILCLFHLTPLFIYMIWIKQTSNKSFPGLVQVGTCHLKIPGSSPPKLCDLAAGFEDQVCRWSLLVSPGMGFLCCVAVRVYRFTRILAINWHKLFVWKEVMSKIVWLRFLTKSSSLLPLTHLTGKASFTAVG